MVNNYRKKWFRNFGDDGLFKIHRNYVKCSSTFHAICRHRVQETYLKLRYKGDIPTIFEKL